METKETNSVKLNFAAIGQVLEDNIITNVQKEIKGKDYVQYGDRNIYPTYLWDLYNNVSVLKSIITGLANCFDNIAIHNDFSFQINLKGQTVEDVAKQIILDYFIYGGFALNIVRNNKGGIQSIYNIDFKNIRSNKKNTKFYYSEDWAEKSVGRVQTVSYPVFDPKATDPSSIYYFKNELYRTYPSPVWGGAVMSAEVLRNISQFNLNSLHNGLSSDYIVNFNAGKPTPEAQEEIEETFDEKYAGFQNCRPMLSFNNDFQHRTTVEAIPQTSYAEKYSALEKTSKQDIYCAFNMNPALLGLPMDGTGFNDNDIRESWKIAMELVFKPVLKVVKRAFEYIFQTPEVLDITVIDIDFDDAGSNSKEEVQ